MLDIERIYSYSVCVILINVFADNLKRHHTKHVFLIPILTEFEQVLIKFWYLKQSKCET